MSKSQKSLGVPALILAGSQDMFDGLDDSGKTLLT
jgi:hypothetical protein